MINGFDRLYEDKIRVIKISMETLFEFIYMRNLLMIRKTTFMFTGSKYRTHLI